MSHHKKHSVGASMIGLLLIIIGAVWILDNQGIFEFELDVWWPLILIALGLIHLAHHRRLTDPGFWILVLLGCVFLLTTNDILEWDEIWRYWPVILILIGFSIIFQRHGKYRPPKTSVDVDEGEGPEPSGEDQITGSVIFGSIERKVSIKKFKGGNISAVFGGAEIDLRSAGLDEKGALLDVSALFGGVDIWIPESWPIELCPSAILGGISNKSTNEEKSSGKRLIINASAIFGGVDIKN
jgi:predicted membrane protein